MNARASLFSRRARGLFSVTRHLLRYGRPARTLLFGPESIGDDLLCTTVLHEARRRNTPFAMMTNRPELFTGNSDPQAIIPIDDYYAQTLRRLGSRVVQPYYVRPDLSHASRDVLPPHHIIAEMCRLAGLTGTITLRPYLTLSDAERHSGRLFPRQIILQSSVLAARIPYLTKEWTVGRMAEVARQLADDATLIQLGSTSDPALPGVNDLRGKTTLRQAAALLANAELFIGLEGFLTHLARAVDCPAVVVHGGRAPAAVFGYGCNINLHSTVPCSPCGLRRDCPHDLRCMSAIDVCSVVTAARTLLSDPGPRPIPAEKCLLP